MPNFAVRVERSAALNGRSGAGGQERSAKGSARGELKKRAPRKGWLACFWLAPAANRLWSILHGLSLLAGLPAGKLFKS
jgi:hypothetical protein